MQRPDAGFPLREGNNQGAMQSNILETEIQTAARVAKLAFDSNPARVPHPTDLVAFIREHVYEPEYKAQVESARSTTA